MPWIRIALVALSAGIATSLTDWLVMGDWLYKRYDRHPEIWRSFGGQSETNAIFLASLLPFLTCAVFAFLCESLHATSYSATFQLAVAIWLIAPLSLTATYPNETRVWIPRSVYRLFYDQSVNYLLALKFDPRRFQEAHTIAQALDFAAHAAGVALVQQSSSRFERSGVLFKP